MFVEFGFAGGDDVLQVVLVAELFELGIVGGVEVEEFGVLGFDAGEGVEAGEGCGDKRLRRCRAARATTRASPAPAGRSS